MNPVLDVQYEKYKLQNGLEIILCKRIGLPLTAVNVWYKVGSANEKKGKTGFAHLFEHMMFQGSQNVGKEMHFKYVQEAGGTLNGSTSNDRTNYYETLPSDSLELALWLESDRMGFLLPALTEEKLENQKDVVMNERRERYDNQPYGRAWEILFNNLYPSDHPYSWPVIGWMEDIEKFELHEVKEFFKTFYAPNNASIVIAGDFDRGQVIESVEKYFGDLPSGKEIPGIHFPQFELTESKFITHEDDVNLPRIYIAFHTVGLYKEEEAELDIAMDFLAGTKSSRLYKNLVFEKQIAQDITAYQFSNKNDGAFILIATAKPNITINDLKKELFNELNNAIETGISQEELERAQNGYKANYIYSLQNLTTYADYLNHFNFFLGEPNSFAYSVGRYENVTVDSVNNTLKKYLTKNYVELQILPKGKNQNA